ncbi:MAG: hypothetical protein ACT4OM_09035 [Actinomycetota bacterium]
MPCFRCNKVQTDPARGKSPWARFVLRGEQVLLCPDCQDADAYWTSLGDRCPYCNSPKLTMVMGSVVCRGCGRDFERTPSFGGS